MNQRKSMLGIIYEHDFIKHYEIPKAKQTTKKSHLTTLGRDLESLISSYVSSISSTCTSSNIGKIRLFGETSSSSLTYTFEL